MDDERHELMRQQFAAFAAKLEQGPTTEDKAQARKILTEHSRRKPAPSSPDSAQLALPLG